MRQCRSRWKCDAAVLYCLLRSFKKLGADQQKSQARPTPLHPQGAPQARLSMIILLVWLRQHHGLPPVANKCNQTVEQIARRGVVLKVSTVAIMYYTCVWATNRCLTSPRQQWTTVTRTIDRSLRDVLSQSLCRLFCCLSLRLVFTAFSFLQVLPWASVCGSPQSASTACGSPQAAWRSALQMK
jgi:hypothetical protein